MFYKIFKILTMLLLIGFTFNCFQNSSIEEKKALNLLVYELNLSNHKLKLYFRDDKNQLFSNLVLN
jgi:cell fate regulator YaaT (PSP1 superfamily)